MIARADLKLLIWKRELTPIDLVCDGVCRLECVIIDGLILSNSQKVPRDRVGLFDFLKKGYKCGNGMRNIKKKAQIRKSFKTHQNL